MVRKIFDISYYLVKRNCVTYCAHCGKKIPIITPVYAKGNQDSSEIFCRECVTALSDRYQNERYGRIPFPTATPLWVGIIGHTCLLLDESNFIAQTAIFRRNNKVAYLPVHYCHKCKRYFIGLKEYQNNSTILSNYRLIHTITEKPIPGSKDWQIDYNLASEEEPEYPASVVWSYQHPFQGGGCSGK